MIVALPARRLSSVDAHGELVLANPRSSFGLALGPAKVCQFHDCWSVNNSYSRTKYRLVKTNRFPARSRREMFARGTLLLLIDARWR